jgi:hypothetical protein
MVDTTTQGLNYVTTNLFEMQASDMGKWSGITPAHTNLIYHHIMLVSSGVLAAGVYNVRIAVHEGENNLEATVDTGVTLTITGKNSAMAVFTGAIRGVSLVDSTPLTAGETISCVLTSGSLPFGALV